MKSLGELLSDGSIVDNTVHEIHGSTLQIGNRSIAFEDRNAWRSQYKAWSFLKAAEATLRRRLILDDESGLFIFGSQNAYEHNTEDSFFELRGGTTHQNFSISTGNLIGSITDTFDGYTFNLHVSSRFGNDFIKFIIADADGFKELPNQGGQKEGGYDWLLIYLWLIKLKKAFRLGLPKDYETKEEHLPMMRGRLDPVDYAINSDRARYRCVYREHSYNNATTRLIARTLQHLDGHEMIRDTHGLNQTFQIATAGATYPLRELLQTNRVKNPYFADYNEVIALSKRILRYDLADFGTKSRTSAFFFDVSMLFEYFVRKLLKREGALFRDKNCVAWTIPTGTRDRKLIPDLVFELGNKTFVFDVKYKRFDFIHGVSREDLFQIHTYVAHLSNESNVAGCGFIYPVSESRWNQHRLEDCGGLWIRQFNQHGRAIPFIVAFIRVPSDPSAGTENSVWSEVFPERFRSSCRDFARGLLHSLKTR